MPAKEKKLPRLPKPFTRTIDEESFNKKIIGRIFNTIEKDFAQSLYTPASDKPGFLVWKKELDKKEAKHLKKLAAQILKNRGFVHTGKLIILATLVAAIVVFSIFFKDKLIEDLLEDALEGTFQAKADIASLNFDPLSGTMRIDYLEVADKDAPLTNLFQFDKTELSVDTWQMLNGRFVIKNLEAQELRFGGPRSTDGSLPPRAGQAKTTELSQAPQFTMDELDTSGFINLSKLDPAGILSQEMDKLKSIAVLEVVKKELETGTATWKSDLSTAESDAKTIETKVKQVQAINVQKLTNPADIQNALKSVQELKTSVDSGIKTANTLVSKAQTDLKRLDALQASSKAAMANDWAYLENIITAPMAFGQDLISSTARQAIGPKAWEIYQVLNKIPTVLGALKSDQAPPPAPEKREGRTVYFPSRTWPRFILMKASASVWIDDTRRASLELTQISSEPDLTASPSTLKLRYDDQVFSAGFDGMVDLRTSAKVRMELTGHVKNYPLDAGAIFDALGLSSLKGLGSAEIDWVMESSGSASLGINGELSKLETVVTGDDFISRVTASIFKKADTISLGLSSSFPVGLAPSFSVKTNLDAVFAGAMEGVMREELNRLKAGLEKEFQALLAKQLAENEALGSLYKDYLADSNGNLKDIKSFDAGLARKQKELESQAAKLLTDSIKLPGGATLPKVELPSSGFKFP